MQSDCSSIPLGYAERAVRQGSDKCDGITNLASQRWFTGDGVWTLNLMVSMQKRVNESGSKWLVPIDRWKIFNGMATYKLRGG